MATKLLDETRIRALHQAALDAGLTAHRVDLLRGLEASFIASLPVSSSLSAQLFTDLHELSVTLRDGSVPVVAWLKHALSLAGGRAEVGIFEEALTHLGHAAPARAAAPVRGEGARAATGDRLDVVILVALHDELEAVLDLGEGGRAGWEEKRDLQRFRYFLRRFPREGGRDLVIAAAWIGEMGERAATSHALRALSGHTESVWSVAFSPDGRALASGSMDTTVRLWNTATGEVLCTLLGHTDSVWSVAFSPDGRSLASGSEDGTVRLWNTATGRCLAVLLSTPEGWVSFVPEAHPAGPPRGAFKMGGDIAGSFWHIIGLARFEPGELDEFLPEGQKLRLPDDYLFLPPPPPTIARPTQPQ